MPVVDIKRLAKQIRELRETKKRIPLQIRELRKKKKLIPLRIKELQEMGRTDIGRNIRRLREAQGMREEDLAQKARISLAHLSHLECGRRLPLRPPDRRP
jgi:ribosome-binding protein aMBF1 (putative translation factor)